MPLLLLALALLLLPVPSSAQAAVVNGTADETAAANGTAAVNETTAVVPLEEDAADAGAGEAPPPAFSTDAKACDAKEGAACWLESRTCNLYADGRTECGTW